MAVYVELQASVVVHRFCVADRAAGLEIVEKLAPYVGRNRFLNSEQPTSMRIVSLDGEAVVSLNDIQVVRVTDLDVFEESDRDRRTARYTESRIIDIDLIERLRSI